VVIAFDPWTLVIAIIIYIILSMMSCDENEGKLAMKEGAGLCHTNGTWCSGCFMVLGVCVSCVEHTTSKCCFRPAVEARAHPKALGEFQQVDVQHPDESAGEPIKGGPTEKDGRSRHTATARCAVRTGNLP
jgi:hypothetical protein